MERILEVIQEMSDTLNVLYQKEERHIFDITATKRRKLTDLFEQKLYAFHQSEEWKTEGKLVNNIQYSFQKMQDAIISENDMTYYRSVMDLSNDMKNFQNRQNKCKTILFATGIPILSHAFKNCIHTYDFLDTELLYGANLTGFIETYQPHFVVISEALECFQTGDKVTEIAQACAQHTSTQFVIAGDIFLQNSVLQTLKNVHLLPSKIEKIQEVIQDIFVTS